MPSLVTYTVTRTQRPDLQQDEPKMTDFSGRAIESFVVAHPTVGDSIPYSEQRRKRTLAV